MLPYLAPWTWETDDTGSHWIVPSGRRVMDLRSTPQCEVRGGTPGLALAFFDVAPVRADVLQLGLGPTGRLIPTLSEVEGWLGLSNGVIDRAVSTVDGLIREVRAHHGDPTQTTRWAPLLSQRLRLGGELVWEGDRKRDQQWHDAWLALHTRDYKRVRRECLDAAQKLSNAGRTWDEVRQEWRAYKAGEISLTREEAAALRELALLREPDQYMRQLDWMAKRYDEDPRDIAGDEYDGTKPHRTTITDTWDSAMDSASNPDGDLDWETVDGTWGVTSNKLQSDGSGGSFPSTARVASAHALDGADHYSQIDFVQADSTARFVGVTARFKSDAETCYYGFVREQDLRRLGRINNGTETILDPDTTSAGPTKEVRIEIVDDDGEMYQDDVLILSFTNDGSPITGNTQTGACGHSSGSAQGDNFEAADLGAPANTRRYSLTTMGVG